jgi:acetyl-CoA acetyltransferase
VDNVYVIGRGMTRFAKFMDRPLRDLAHEAVNSALSDAGLSISDIEAAYCGNAIAGLITNQEMVRGQVALRSMGFEGIPIVNTENACASGSTAVHLAWTAIKAGLYDVVLVLGAEKMTHPDKRKTALAIATALDVEEPFDPNAKSPFMDVYAEKVRKYLAHSEATVEDFAKVVVKAQFNGSMNPVAQYGGNVTTEQVLSSALISDPLTLMMCSPVSDGAAALVLVSEKYIAKLGIKNPIKIAASVLQSGSSPENGLQAGERAANLAYERAGLGPSDIDVIELHDATASAEIMRYESLGLAREGEGCRLIRDGSTDIGGTIPVNPSGGLLTRGHPIGATGVGQLVELIGQLRGECGPRQVEGAMVALAENGGGWIGGDSAVDCIHVLTR